MLRLSGRGAAEEPAPFATLTRQEALSELGCFREKSFNAKRCQATVAKLLFLLQRGEAFSADELDDVFISVSKLFQTSDPALKRLLFLAMRQLRAARSFCLVTNSVNKSAAEGPEHLKAAAIRLLPLVAEQQNPLQLERQLKMALIHGNARVVEGALLACRDLLLAAPDLARRCAEELQQVCVEGRPGLAAKALCVLRELRRAEPAALARTLLALLQGKAKLDDEALFGAARAAGDLLARNAGERALDAKTRDALVAFLFELSEKTDAKGIEAAAMLVNCPDVENKRLKALVERLAAAIAPEEEALSFAVLTLFSALLQNSWRAGLLAAPPDLHALLQSENKSLVALAVSVLLKTCGGEGADELLGRVLEHMEQLPPAVQAEVARDCARLGRKSPALAGRVLRFLWDCLRERGDKQLKAVVVDAMCEVAEASADCGPQLLDHFCEYIEDSMDAQLTLQIMERLVALVPDGPPGLRCLKHLLNRLTLDAAPVRAAAVTCLGLLGAARAQLREPVGRVLRSLAHGEEGGEVAARAGFYLALLEAGDRGVCERSRRRFAAEGLARAAEQLADALKEPAFSLRDYDLQSLERRDAQAEEAPASGGGELLSASPELEALGPAGAASAASPLSDEGADLFVTARKLAFAEAVVVELLLRNNIDCELRDVAVQARAEGLRFQKSLGQQTIAAGEQGRAYLLFRREGCLAAGTVSLAVRFRAVTLRNGAEVNAYADELALEELEVRPADFLAKLPRPLSAEAFEREWAQPLAAAAQSYELEQFSTVALATAELARHFGVTVCADSAEIGAGQTAHTLCLAGTYLGAHAFFVKVQLGFDPRKKKIVTAVTAKSASERLSAELVDL